MNPKSPGGQPANVVVAGTDFGRVYLDAISQADPTRLRLTGIIGRGSTRTLACARHYGVPHWTDADQVPETADLVCVVVGGRANAGPGGELAERLLRRGLNVLQEHPCQAQEIADLTRLAHRSSTTYAVQCHYADLPVIRRFHRAVRALAAREPPEQLTVITSRLMLTPAVELAATVAGSLTLADITSDPASRRLTATFGQLPTTLEVQNTYQPLRPDAGARIELSATAVFPTGALSLLSPQGPLFWIGRFHRPAGYDTVVNISELDHPELDLPAWLDLTGAPAPTRRTQLGHEWTTAVRSGIESVLALCSDRAAAIRWAQRWIALARITDRANESLGPPTVIVETEPDLISEHELLLNELVYPDREDRP